VETAERNSLYILAALASAALGLQFEDISVVLLVRNGDVRMHLRNAEKHLSDGDVRLALAEVKSAYIRAQPPDLAFTGALEYYDDRQMDRVKVAYPDLVEPLTAISLDVGTLRVLLAQALKGVDTQRWAWFHSVTPRVLHEPGGFVLMANPSTSWPSGTAEAAFDFALEAILRWQEQGVGPGSAGFPFPLDWPDEAETEVLHVFWRGGPSSGQRTP
jgi:hypothetical protein